MLKQETILATLNKLLNQSPRIRKGTDAVYFCPSCNHYKRKFEVNLDSGKYHFLKIRVNYHKTKIIIKI